jgi:hypothetical protein
MAASGQRSDDALECVAADREGRRTDRLVFEDCLEERPSEPRCNGAPMMVGQIRLEDSIFVAEAGRTSVPHDADAFARAAIRAICEASVTPRVGYRTYERCLRALSSGATARLGFRHPGKADAIDLIWRERHRLYRDYLASADKLAFLTSLPWIGPVTRHAMARHLGLTSAPEERESQVGLELVE